MSTDNIHITADDRGRAPLARLGVTASEQFRAERQPDGNILLIPLATVPVRELIVWENPELRRSILTGIAEAAAGLTLDSGAFLDDMDTLDTTDDDDEVQAG